jgi:hypothetical protein
MPNSYNGYSVISSSSSSMLHKWVVPGTDRYFVLRRGSVGFILCHLILWYHETIQRLNRKGEPWDEWAYAYRYTRGSTSWSNHASATAVDLNASLYPLGTTLMTRWRRVKIRLRLKVFRGCIRWGGDYEGRKDQMHFEINRPIGAVERVARRLMKSPRGRRILAANPGQRRVILS